MKLLLLTLAVIAAAPLAQAATKPMKATTIECKVSTGDDDMTEYRVLKTVRLSAADSTRQDISVNGLYLVLNLMEQNRIILQTKTTMLQGHGDLFYSDFANDLKVICDTITL
jgi:environmental stress-induced protein Ves